MQGSVVVVTAAKMIVLGCTGILASLAYRAYRRTGSSALCTLVVGLTFVACGSLLGGVLYQFGSLGFDVSIGVESAFTAFGFVVVIYSLYVGNARDGFTP
ncbi:hypothetical protein Hrd1104_09235 [Halorhabdus sp. CBA1104]|uniref:DUF7521 family protein n=1 Tax=unclassified Halorhabdus TaxID=2621901 RepID=UPI0012B42766|nr:MULTISPECIES: hypothetical protein [unclassified Halorhabdus]QGN07474.1 hypothetical protein Hrd1104_09235 [Halorhabdus sp. CBA1104]